MYRVTTVLVAMVAMVLAPADAVEIKQANDDLTQGVDWDYDSLTDRVIILQEHSDETFIFWAHANGDPGTLAPINLITRDASVDSGTIKLVVGKPSGELLASGATDIGSIAIDHEDVTSIIEGIRISGNFLTQDPMTVDHVSGDVLVGGSLQHTLTVLQDVEAPVSFGDAIDDGVELQIGGDLSEDISVVTLDGSVYVGGNMLIPADIFVSQPFEGAIEVCGRAESDTSFLRVPLYFAGGFLDGVVRVRNATVVNGGPLTDDPVVLSLLDDPPADFPVLHLFEATQPEFYNSPTTPFGGGGSAEADFTFDIMVTRPDPEGALAATIVLNDPGSPTTQFDLRVPMDLISLTLAPELLEDPYPYLHNLYVGGDVNTGTAEYAIDIPDAAVNSIYIGGVVGSEDGEENLFDRIRVASIGTLAFGSLGSENLYVPEDGISGSGTAVIVADDFLRSNDFIQQFSGTPQPTSFHYSHADSTGSPAGFTRNYQGATTYVSFYHRNSSDECILDSDGPYSWCCAKGPVSDIDNSGVVSLTDFTLFALCFGLSSPSQDCPSDQLAHADLDLNGTVGLNDFSTFAVAFVPQTFDNIQEDDCCASPPCTEPEPDLEFLQEFLEETIEPLISGDNDWVAAIQALTAEIAAFEPEEEYEGIVDALEAINFKPVAVDSAVSVAKNGSKIMSLGTSSDPDGDTLLRDLVTTDPAHGTLSEGVYDFDGNLISFRYTPDTDYTGEDTLTWRATEVGTTQEYYDEAVITITVTE